MKRLLAVLMMVAILLTLFSCSRPKNNDAPDSNTQADGGSDAGDGVGESEDNGNTPTDTYYTVSLKDGDGTLMSSFDVLEGTVIDVPEMPDVEGFDFLGWFSDPDGTVEFDLSTPVIADISIYAKWERKGVFTDKGEVIPLDAPNSVTLLNVDVNTKKISATVKAAEDCDILVRFVDEDLYFSKDFDPNGQLDCMTVKESVSSEPEGGLSSVELEVTEAIPEHFVAYAVLVSKDGESISDGVANIRNSQRYSEFESKTADGIDSTDRLIRFDEKNNFGVLADDVKMLNAESVSEIFLNDSGDSFFYITSPSAEISVGEKAYVKAADGSEALFKVLNVKKGDGVVTVVPAKAGENDGYALKDFYKFLKADMSVINGVNDAANGNARSSSDIDMKEIKLPPLILSYEDVSFKAEVNGRIGIDCNFVYAPELFGDDYFECEVTVVSDYVLDLSASVEAGSGGDDDDDEPKRDVVTLLKVPTPIFAGFSPKVEMGVGLSWSLEAAVGVKIPVNRSATFTYSTDAGFSKSSTGNDVKPEVYFEGEAEIKVGPHVALGVEFLKGVVHAEMTMERGISLSVTNKDDENLTAAGARHDCYLCLVGSIDSYVEIGASVGVNLFKGLTLGPYGVNIYSDRDTILSGHWSKETEEDELEFDVGDCKNYTARFLLRNLDGCINDECGAGTIDWTVGLYDGDTLIKSVSRPKEGQYPYEVLDSDDVLLDLEKKYRLKVRTYC